MNSEAYVLRGVARLKKRQTDDALTDFTSAIRLDPNAARAFRLRALIWKSKGDADHAMEDYNAVIRLKPNDAPSYVGRGGVYWSKGLADDALRDWAEALRLDPNSADAHGDLAWFLATFPEDRYRDGNRAVENATKACNLSNWKSRRFVGALAAAYAGQGKFEEAIRWQTKAIELHSTAQDRH